MPRLTRSWGSGVLFLFVACGGARSDQFKPLDYRRVSGCYALSVGRWSIPLSGNRHTIPEIIRLDTASRERGGRLLSPDIHFPRGSRTGRWPRWDIRGDTVALVWSNGFTPTLVWLRTKDHHLEGWAEARTDIVVPGDNVWPRAHVLARRVDCNK
jgi:hypothetical protein